MIEDVEHFDNAVDVAPVAEKDALLKAHVHAVIVRKISGCTEEDPCKQSVDLVAGSRCDRRDRDAGAARDRFERGEQGPMPRGRWQPWPEWAKSIRLSLPGGSRLSTLSILRQ